MCVCVCVCVCVLNPPRKGHFHIQNSGPCVTDSFARHVNILFPSDFVQWVLEVGDFCQVGVAMSPSTYYYYKKDTNFR